MLIIIINRDIGPNLSSRISGARSDGGGNLGRRRGGSRLPRQDSLPRTNKDRSEANTESTREQISEEEYSRTLISTRKIATREEKERNRISQGGGKGWRSWVSFEGEEWWKMVINRMERKS